MQKEIIISDDEYESRCAIVEDGVLSEIEIERRDDEQALGNVYKGRVENVLPGMQIAFVDIGLDRHAFLHASDIHYDFEAEDIEKDSTKEGLGSNAIDSPRGGRGSSYSISNLLRKNQEILLQVVKEPIGTKGPRVTACVTLPGRFIVYLSTSSSIGVSRRIEAAEERQRLKDIAQSLRSDVEGGFIIRTAAEGASETELAAEIRYLIDQWKGICERAEKMSAPQLVHQDLSFTARMVRDYLTKDVTQLFIDSKEKHRETLKYLSSALPELQSRVKLYDKPSPIFEAYGIEKELKKALTEKIWLKCGGHIIIQQTEAMFSIDVNTGKFVGKGDPDDTILSANLEAVTEVVRQVRLRDIGGIIVIDFIDMDLADHRKMVFKLLQEALKKDRARTNILHFSEIGLVEMTRQRTRPSLPTMLTEPCPYCEGHGTVLSVDTVTIGLLRTVKKAHQKSRKRKLEIMANELIVSHLRNEESDKVRQLEESMKLTIRFKEDPDMHLEDYRIFAQDTNREIYVD